MSDQVDTERTDGTEGGNVRWQTKTTTLNGAIAHIYKTKEFADIQFNVGSKTFKAHKLILAARSPVFAKMFMQKGNAPAITNIEISNVSEEGFDTLLRYIYLDELIDLERNIIVDVYHAATRFEQQGLLKLCDVKVAELEITYDNFFELLGTLSDFQSIRDRCLSFARADLEGCGSYPETALVFSDKLKAATADTVWMMLEMGFFKHGWENLMFELLVIERVVCWAVHQFPEQSDFKLVRDFLLQKSRPFLSRLGIEKLSSQVLATVVSEYKDLLTPTEVTQFFVNAHNPGTMPLPDWCIQ